MRSVGVWWVVMVSLVVGAPRALSAPPADVLGYAAFGIERVTIGAKSRVTGDVGSLFEQLALGPGSRVTGAVAAPTVSVRKHARVTGGYFCSDLEGTDEACQPLPNPLIDGPTIVLAQPGVLDVSLRARATADAPLPAGAYGALSLGAASQVTLAGGSYHFESIDVKSRAKLVCLAACDLTVRTAVTIGQAARLGPADGVAGSAIVRIAGQSVGTAFDAKSRATVVASVYAPSADVKIGAAAKLTGGVVGNRVTIGARARLKGPVPG